jgi:hypothetical protein
VCTFGSAGSRTYRGQMSVSVFMMWERCMKRTKISKELRLQNKRGSVGSAGNIVVRGTTTMF